MALIGILLVALNLRTAVSSISPIVSEITVDVPLDSAALGVIGAVPPVAFALAALFGALAAKRLGLERLITLAIVAMVIGHLLRAVATGFAVILLGSVVALVGAGIGNVLLPPLVKRYFPDRIGLITSLYATLLAVSTALAAAVAAPVADSAGWRYSLAIWGALAVTGIVPWSIVLLQHRRERSPGTTALESAQAERAGDEATELEEPSGQLLRGVWRSRVAWTLGIIFALSSFDAYVAYAWLPQLLIDTAGVTAVQAGALLALFSIVGIPAALIVPRLVTRPGNVGWLIESGIASLVVGYLGLQFFPTTVTWLWVILIGLGNLLFPACLTLIGLRSRTHEGAVALSGVVQTVGYTIGAFGPLVVALLRTVTGGWTAAIILLIVTALACTVTAARLSKPVFVEDDLR